MKVLRDYTRNLANDDMDCIYQALKNETHQRLVKSAAIYERLQVPLIICCFIRKKTWGQNFPNLKNITRMAHQNYICILNLLSNQLNRSYLVESNHGESSNSSSNCVQTLTQNLSTMKIIM